MRVISAVETLRVAPSSLLGVLRLLRVVARDSVWSVVSPHWSLVILSVVCRPPTLILF